MPIKILICGASAAGYTAARILAQNPEYSVTLIDKAAHEPVNICKFTDYAAHKISRESLSLATRQELAQSSLQFLPNTELLGIDATTQRAHLTALHTATTPAREFVQPYDLLLLALGTTAYIPQLVHEQNAIPAIPFHTLENTETILRLLSRNTQTPCIVIIGGGINGVELAAALHTHNISITLIERAPQILPFLPPEAAQLIQAHLEKAGVRIICEATAHAVTQNGVETTAGFIPAALAITTTGVQATTKNLDISAHKTETGELLVDQTGATSVPTIFAAGDCAAHREHTALTNNTNIIKPAYRWGSAVRAGIIIAQGLQKMAIPALPPTPPSVARIGPVILTWSGVYTKQYSLKKIIAAEYTRWDFFDKTDKLQGFAQIGMLKA